ncbi:MAG: DUF2294 domain-containing protein [Kiritimatiellaceae bacterium]|nr:DUF2294 domain-containing protein [Kiritimatiellaceae bacterium]
MPKKTQIEHQISDAIINFEKEYMGRGPLETQTYIIDNMILVRLKGVLTRAELQLVKSEDTDRGRKLIKEVRIELIEKGRPLLDAAVEAITGQKVVSLHTDISTVTGERVILFTTQENIIKSP